MLMNVNVIPSRETHSKLEEKGIVRRHFLQHLKKLKWIGIQAILPLLQPGYC